MKIVSRENRPRPLLVTPDKGSAGDCTDETMVGMCDINRIIQRYGGNLAELAAWRGSMSYGDQPPDNLEDALEILKGAKDICSDLGVETIFDAINKLNVPRGTIINKEEKGVENEKAENKSENIPTDIPKDGE